ncbi:MAG: flagellar biosynthetic protein FliO [Lachnospiraceae bacterium]|nr:flagellar biosynthetic protein FliO [Lachnospiraceae bacterium]MDD5854142.1 flagellar biosynthetic protein FliO [Lachnospiraceae bacterium]
MLLVTTSTIDSAAQLLTVIVLFIVVLIATWLTTRYVAGVQKGKLSGSNFETVDTFRLSQNKYVQIMRIGHKYLAVAVCRDTVTVLCELQEDEITFRDEGFTQKAVSFEDFFNKAKEIAGKKQKRTIDKDDEEHTIDEL